MHSFRLYLPAFALLLWAVAAAIDGPLAGAGATTIGLAAVAVSVIVHVRELTRRHP